VPGSWATHRLAPESLLNVSLINLHGSRNCFAYRGHPHNYAHHRNDGSNRSETRALCSISGPRSNVDAYGVDRHRDGPIGERARRWPAQALDRRGARKLADSFADLIPGCGERSPNLRFNELCRSAPRHIPRTARVPPRWGRSFDTDARWRLSSDSSLI
jgi:hypothetical protein